MSTRPNSGQPDFFSDVESLSPKLKWLRKHGLTTTFDAGWTADMQESPETGDTLHPWSCYKSDLKADVTFATAGLGATEDEAIISYCEKHGLTHYTLEESP